MGLLVLDAGKAERELGWRAAWSVVEVVAAAAHWYREFYGGADAPALLERCCGDIAAYCDAAAHAGSAWTAAELHVVTDEAPDLELTVLRCPQEGRSSRGSLWVTP